MHLKLDIGPETQVVLDIHDLNKKNPLHGISDPASNESAVLTGSEKTLMADHLFDQVAIYKG